MSTTYSLAKDPFTLCTLHHLFQLLRTVSTIDSTLLSSRNASVRLWIHEARRTFCDIVQSTEQQEYAEDLIQKYSKLLYSPKSISFNMAMEFEREIFDCNREMTTTTTTTSTASVIWTYFPDITSSQSLLNKGDNSVLFAAYLSIYLSISINY